MYKIMLPQLTEINRPHGGPKDNEGTQGCQHSLSERHFEKEPDTSTEARDILSHESVKHSDPQAVLPTSMKTRSHRIHTAATERPRVAFFLSPISLLANIGEFFENILLTRNMREVNERRLLHDD